MKQVDDDGGDLDVTVFLENVEQPGWIACGVVSCGIVMIRYVKLRGLFLISPGVDMIH